MFDLLAEMRQLLLSEHNPDGYLADPEAYHRSLWTNMPYYVMILSPEEMTNPLPALKARRQVLTRDRAKTVVDRRSQAAWPPILEHFVTVHGIARARFKPAQDEIATYEQWAAGHLKMLDEIEKTLEDKIKAWSAPAGKAELAQVKAGGNSEYLRQADASIAAHRAELIRLRTEAAAGRGPAAPILPLPDIVIKVPGDPNMPFDLNDLGIMHAKDIEDFKGHPEHWKK